MEAIPLTCSFGASVLRKHLNALREEVDGVRRADDIEAIHRMRVASRRLRAALPLFADCFRKKQVKTWLREIKGITSALGAARDTDVQLDLLQKVAADAGPGRLQPGLRRLTLRIRQSRQSLQAPIITALDRLDQATFYAQMDDALVECQPELYVGMPFSHHLFERSAAAVQKRLKEFLSYEPYIPRPECIAELHAMRIAAKGLRYTLETLAPIYPGELQPFIQAVKTSQELLGDIHDCDVWLSFLPQFIDEERQRTVNYYGHANPFRPLMPGLAFFQSNRQQERTKKYEEFKRRWEKWKADDLWNQLSQTVAAPVFTNVFPLAPDRPAPEENREAG